MSTAPPMAITVHDLGKQYHLGSGHGAYRTLRESLAGLLGRPFLGHGNTRQHSHAAAPDTIWALRGVSLEIPPGEILGIIGRNGAGKTTLLKVLSRITEPTEGRVTMRGRVGSLLEVGTGFHQELTGRENIYLNGAILGMSRREVQRRFEEIVAFAEIEPFLDTPLKRYSTGMGTEISLCRGGPPGDRHPPGGRGAGGGGHGLPQEMPGEDAGRDPGRPHGAFRQPRHE